MQRDSYIIICTICSYTVATIAHRSDSSRIHINHFSRLKETQEQQVGGNPNHWPPEASPRQIFKIMTEGGESPAAQPHRDGFLSEFRSLQTHIHESHPIQKEKKKKLKREEARKEASTSECTCRVWAGSCQPCFRAMAQPPSPRSPPSCSGFRSAPARAQASSSPFSRPTGGSKGEGGRLSFPAPPGLVPGSSVMTRKQQAGDFFY